MQKVCKNTSVEIDSWNQESLLPGKLSNKAQVGNPTKSQVQGQIFDLVLRNVHLSIDRYFSLHYFLLFYIDNILNLCFLSKKSTYIQDYPNLAQEFKYVKKFEKCKFLGWYITSNFDEIFKLNFRQKKSTFFAFKCPCAAIKKAEEAKIEAQRKDEEIRKKLEKKTERDKERARREELIEKRRQHYYQSLKRAETKESQPKIHDPTALTKLDSKRSSMKTLDQISEISR